MLMSAHNDGADDHDEITDYHHDDHGDDYYDDARIAADHDGRDRIGTAVEDDLVEKYRNVLGL